MTRFERTSRLLMWMALLLSAFAAGCGSGGGDGGTAFSGQGTAPPSGPGAGSGVGGVGRGPPPLDLQTAGEFVILAETQITNVPASVITGDVGLSPASGSNIELTCDQVAGVIYTMGSAGPRPCHVANAGRLNTAVSHAIGAYNDGIGRAPDYTEVRNGNLGGLNLPPATYKWSGGVQIPADLTLSGGPNDVWIFLITQDLIVSPGVRIILEGGALPQNVFWLTLALDADVDLGASSQFKGIVMSETSIAVRAGASIEGRLMAATSLSLDQNTVTQP